MSQAPAAQQSAERALDQLGKPQGGAIFQIWANNLHADRRGGGRQTDERRHRRPYDLVEIGIGLAVDVDVSVFSFRRMIVRKHWRRHGRAKHDIHSIKRRHCMGCPRGMECIGN